MKDMDGAARKAWREVFEKHHSALVDEVSSLLDSELEKSAGAIAEAERANSVRQVEAVRRATAESLNQALRRLRQAASESETLQVISDASAPWADRVVVLSFENNQARSLSARGLQPDSFTFDIESAAAIRSVVDSKGPEAREPLVALASASEISPVLADAFSRGAPESGIATGKAYLFPLVVRQTVVAMVIAAGEVVPAPLELLSEASGMKLELLAAPPAFAPLKNAELIHIGGTTVPEPAVPASATAEKRRWDELSADDQKLHLQAQRVARVKVAELRLYNADELRKGIFAGDIYNALRAGIDEARTEFLQSFLSKSPTMVDYLHLEILRSLAHDDDRLLGKNYPGPMV